LGKIGNFQLANTLSSLRMIGWYSGKRVADTLVSLHASHNASSVITFEFYQKTCITLAVVNIWINYRQSGCGSDSSMSKTEQLNTAVMVGEVTSCTELQTAVLGIQ